MNKDSMTIISVNMSKNILQKYKDYHVIEDNLSKEEIDKYSKILFFNCLDNLSNQDIINLYDYLNKKNIKFINYTNNCEEVLYTPYLIVYNNEQIVIEGKTMEVLKEDKLLKRVGIELPFMVDLSLLLQSYNLIDKICLDYEELGRLLWN